VAKAAVVIGVFEAEIVMAWRLQSAKSSKGTKEILKECTKGRAVEI
jgi:hypothetical protein